MTWSDDSGARRTATGTTIWSISNVALRLGVNHTWITAEDAAGNSRSVLLTVTVVDEIAPTVAVTAPTRDGSYASNVAAVSLAGLAVDNVGVAEVVWINDRGGSGRAEGLANWFVPSIPLQAGRNVLTLTARDAAGNAARTIVAIDYQPDTIAPAITITTPTSRKHPTAPPSGSTSVARCSTTWPSRK